MPHKLQTQITFLLENPGYQFLHSEELWIRNGVRVNPKIKHLKGHNDIFLRSLEFCVISPSTVILSRELFSTHQGFDESMIVCEDYDFWLRILLKENIGFIPTPLIKKHGGHADQLSTKFVAMDYWRIKSLVGLYLKSEASNEQKQLIKEVIARKSDLLLKSYSKYQNQSKFDEISEMIALINT